MNDKFLHTLLRLCSVLSGAVAAVILAGCLWLSITPANQNAAGMNVTQNLVTSIQNAASAERAYINGSTQNTVSLYMKARKQAGADLAAARALKGQDRRAANVIDSASRILAQLDHAAQLHKAGRTAEAAAALKGVSENSSAYSLREMSLAAEAEAGTALSAGALDNIKKICLSLAVAAIIITLILAAMIAKLKRMQSASTELDEQANTSGLPLVKALPIDMQKTEEQFQRIVETSRDGIWVVNTDGETTFVNPRMADILGYSVKEMLGRHHVDFMDAEGLRIAEENTRRRKMGLMDTEDFRFVRKDGTIIWALVATNTLKDGKGVVMGAVAMVSDITACKRTEQEQVIYKNAVEACSAGIAVVDAEDDMPIIFVNRAFESITGYRSDEAVGHPASMLRGSNRHGDIVCAIQMARRCGADVCAELCSVRKDNTEYRHELCVSPIRNEQGNITHFVAVQTGLTQVQSAEATRPHPAEIAVLEAPIAPPLPPVDHLFSRPVRDELTGLSNEKMFREDLEHETQRSFRYNTPLSVLILDIDNFEDFIAAEGHASRDQAIVSIGEIIQDTARQTDRVARISGARFAVIMVNTDQANSTVLAERLRRNIERGDWPPASPLTATVGVATLGVGMADANEFLRSADEALLHAQAQGRNRVRHRGQFGELPANAAY